MGTGMTAVQPGTYALNTGNTQTGAAQPQTLAAVQPGAEQKNTAPEEAESTAVNTDPAKHTAPEQAVIDEYQAAVDDKLVIRDNKGAKMERYSLKPVTERTANHSMRDIHDIARLQYVLDHYDTASYGGRTQAYQTAKPNGRPGQADTVVFSKAVNGTYYVVEAVPVTKKKTVFITSAYMSKQKAGDVQTADADAWRVTSETKNAQSPAMEAQASTNSIIQSGKNYNSNPQPAAQTGNTSAKTGPAPAALRQEYQTRIADAIQAGDYEHAYALYREYRSPELRAFKDFYARKTFTEYAGANAYGLHTDTAVGTEKSLAAFEESYRNAVETSSMDDTAFVPAQTLEEAQKYAKEVLGLKQTAAYSDGLNIEFANGLNEAIYKISMMFKNLTKSGYLDKIMLYESKKGEYASYSPGQAAVKFNVSLAKLKNAVAQMAQDATEEFENGSWSTGSPFHSIYHELGHVVQHTILDNDTIAQRKIDILYDQIFSDIIGTDIWSAKNEALIKKGCTGAKEIGFCYYGLKNSGEFVAESIAQFFISDSPCEIAKNVITILKGGD